MEATQTTGTSLPRRLATCLRYVCIALLITPIWITSSTAAPVTVSFSDIASITPGAPQQPSEGVQSFLARRLIEQFTQLGFDARSGFALSEFALPESTQELARTCPVPLPKQARTDASTVLVKLMPSSQVELTLDSIRALRVRFVLEGELHSAPTAQVEWGQAIPFVGNCSTIGTDSGALTVHLPFVLDAAIDLQLTPQFDETTLQLIIDKSAQGTGNIQFGAGWIEPDFGGVNLTDAVINAFEGNLLGRIAASGQQTFSDGITRLNYALAGLDSTGQPDPALDPFNGPTRIDLLKPGSSSTDIERAFLLELHFGDALVTLLDNEGARLLAELVVLDESQRKTFFAGVGTDLFCGTILDHFSLPTVQRTPLFAFEGDSCVAADLQQGNYSAYFSDNVCSAPVAFRATPRTEFCASFNPNATAKIGDAAAWVPDTAQPADPLPDIPSRNWTLRPSTQLNLGVLDGSANFQPYVKALAYKSVDTGRGSGTCTLEMRAYKQDILATNLKPMLAIHGGTWSSRGFSFLGLESTIREFTNRGFIVFAPFYRLVGVDDGNIECNNATWRELTTDIEDALLWVQQYGPALGATKQPISVFGQSSGAHLATWLAVNKPNSVARGLLLYPPSDVLSFLNGAVPSAGVWEKFRDFGVKSLTKLYGADSGNDTLRLARIAFGGLEITTLRNAASTAIPDDVFSFTNIDLANPPRYLTRCAASSGTDLSLVNDANVPPPLLACLKQDLAEFLIANSFVHQINANTPDLFLIHGTADDLVPVEQTTALCAALADGLAPAPIDTDHMTFSCGNRSQAHVVRGAQHALDLGLCLGALCPAGQPGSASRLAVADTLLTGYAWISADSAPVPLSNDTSGSNPDIVVSASPSRQSGGGVFSPWLLLCAGWLVLRARLYRMFK